MNEILLDLRPITILSTVIYAVLGLALFAGALFVMDKVTTFSLRKEIEEDQNISLAILMGSIFIAIAIIIQAAIRG